jgi:hypothetical protein
MYTRDEFGGYMYPDNAFTREGGRHNPFQRSMKLWGGGKGSAPDSNPGQIASAEAAKEIAGIQKETATDYLNFYKEQYKELKPILTGIYESEIEVQKANKQRADEYAQFERETFRPLEKQLVESAKAFDTEGKREELARAAAGDIGQAFGVARGQQSRQMASVGLRPDSGRFAALNQNLVTQEALSKAGAQTRARSDAEGLGYARMQDAASLGRGLASNASTAYGVSLSAGQAAGNQATAGTQLMGQGYQGAGQAYGGAASSYGTAGNIYGQEFQGRMQGYQAQQQAKGAFYQGLGSMAGVGAGIAFRADGGTASRGMQYADGTHVGGGKVSGPGGPVDDKIPAMLSNGEYVLPADTVKKIGVKKLDKVVKETHTPAAIQRKRKALKGKK